MRQEVFIPKHVYTGVSYMLHAHKGPNECFTSNSDFGTLFMSASLYSLNNIILTKLSKHM